MSAQTVLSTSPRGPEGVCESGSRGHGRERRAEEAKKEKNSHELKREREGGAQKERAAR